MKKIIKLRKTLKSNIIFNKEIAKRYHDTRYYEAMASEIKMLPNKDTERQRYATSSKSRITKLISQYKKLLHTKSGNIFKQLEGIYRKNQNAAFHGKTTTPNSNLLYLVSSIPMLVVAYKKIKGNKGAMTLGYVLSKHRRNTQKTWLNKMYKLPDGMSKTIFIQTSKLLRTGQYPWGASKRIYIDKPGQPGVKRPITIPPFMDRVVQAAIMLVLEAIYEPWFEKNNNSFGFRPRKGVHDCIYSLTNHKSNGLHFSIEGDIKAAYDKVNRQKLKEILEKKIQDRQFIKLIEQRLDYQYYDTAKQTYVEDTVGLPQGGIDSPYLWNIYMLEFDNFVTNKTTELFDKLNKNLPKKGTEYYPHRKLGRARSTLKFITRLLNKYKDNTEKLNHILTNTELQKAEKQEDPKLPKEIYGLKKIIKEMGWTEAYKNKKIQEFKYKIIKQQRLLSHQFRQIPATDPNKKRLRFIYSRYADDWILLSNAPIEILIKLKQLYKEFLQNTLYATMSEEKTLITNMTIKPAHFLGFELKVSKTKKTIKYSLVKRDKTIKVVANSSRRIYCLPDRQRLISRFHLKGYCTATGFPREIPWLAILEPYIIIERFNAVLRGIHNYYAEFVDTPQKSLSRWTYIVRYSCLKTLAQKYKTTIGGVFRKYSKNVMQPRGTRSRTIAITVNHSINKKQYKKTWQLLTHKELLDKAKQIKRKKEVADNFWALEKGIPIKYNFKDQGLTCIKDDNYLDRIKWVNLKSQAPPGPTMLN